MGNIYVFKPANPNLDPNPWHTESPRARGMQSVPYTKCGVGGTKIDAAGANFDESKFGAR